MGKSNLLKTLTLLLAFQFLTSCAAPAPQAMATSTVATATETAISTSTPSEPYELVLNDSQKIILNVSSSDFGIGFDPLPGTTEIWESTYPFNDKRVLLPHTENTNYFSPIYSPDGEWIAYIVSKPVFDYAGRAMTPGVYGSDSIWIMRKDGTDKRQISPSFASTYVVIDHNRYYSQRIETYMDWSPDGNYLHFYYQNYDTVNHTWMELYILDSTSGKCSLVASVPYDTNLDFKWAGKNGFFFYEIDDAIWVGQITKDGIDQDEISLLPNGDDLPENHTNIGWTPGQEGLIVLSHDEGRVNWVIWQYDFWKDSWINKMEYSGERLYFNVNWGFYFGSDDNFHFIDLSTWEPIDIVVSENDTFPYLSYHYELNSASGVPILNFRDEHTENILGVEIGKGKELSLLIDWQLFDPSNEYMTIDYDWSP
jgi:hypothetical protein